MKTLVRQDIGLFILDSQEQDFRDAFCQIEFLLEITCVVVMQVRRLRSDQTRTEITRALILSMSLRSHFQDYFVHSEHEI
ncbi:MAG: hypothetical protein CMM47_08450 [Rhodospirillaceae bacterium]|nr:hypothetical protein [Rhodospirillaceae bacterium]